MPPATPTARSAATDLTIVVSADDVDGLAVRDLALQWHQDGLLGDFAWVTPADVDREPYGPPVIGARVTDRDGTVELMSYIGMRPRSLIRVVLLHLLTHEMSDADTLVYTCDEIAELVNRSRPRTVDPEGRQHGSTLLRVNLMVPESDLLPQDPRIILPAWEVNAVVSPEDRPELDRQSVFVRRSVNLHSHALGAAATVGGLWHEAGAGVFDSHESDSTTGGGEIVVMRCQVRVVVGDDGVERLTRSVITALEESPVGAPAWVSWGVPAENPSALVRSCTEALLTSPGWAPLEREPEPLRKEQIPIGAAVRQWFTFQLLLLPAILHFLFGWGRGLVERRVTALTVGTDAGSEATLRPLPPDAVQKIAEGRMKQVEDTLRPDRLEEEAAAWGQTAPAAWRELRDLAIGLVDGGRIASRYPRGSHGGAVEVVPPGSVVGAPDDDYALWSGDRVGLVDVELAARAVAEIEEAREEEERAAARAAAAGARWGKHALRARVAEPATRPAAAPAPPPADPRPADEEEPADEAGAPEDQPAEPAETADAVEQEHEDDEAAEEEEEEQVDELDDEEGHDPDDPEEFLSWLEQRRATLLWQVTSRALEQRGRERDRAEGAQKAIADAKPPSTDKLESAKTFLVTCWGLALGALALIALLNLWSLLTDPVEFVTSLPDVFSGDVVRVVLIVLAVLLVAGTMYFQAMKSYDWAVTKRLHALQQASDDYVTSRHEERRWQLMHRGLVDWARILSEVLHRPWDPPESPQVLRLPAYGGLPAAVGVGVPVPERDQPDPRFIARAVEVVCQKGWLSAELDRVVASSPANSGRGSERDDIHGDLPADLDLGLRRRGPRRELADVAARRATKQAATQALLETITWLLHSGDVRVPARTVMRVGFHSQGDTALDREFLTPRDQVAPLVTEVFAPEAQLAQYQVPERTILLLPMGIEVPPGLRSTRRATVLPSRGTATVRVDLSAIVTHDNISLFHRVLRPEYRPTTSPDDFN